MKKTYIFDKNRWENEELFYAYSPSCKAYKEFITEKGCIINSYNDEIKDYDYISMLHKEKLKEGDIISTKCSFEKFGAPLIVFSDDIQQKNGHFEYGLHFEVVAWEKGCNVWHIIPWPERVECPRKSTLIGTEKFEISDNSIIEITASVKNKEIIIDINGYNFRVHNDDIPESFYAGITACEGINRFYELTIDRR